MPNEILQIIALKVLCGIASDIAESGYYNILADASKTTTKNGESMSQPVVGNRPQAIDGIPLTVDF